MLLVGLPARGARVSCLPPRTHHPKEPTSRAQRPQVPTPGTPPPRDPVRRCPQRLGAPSGLLLPRVGCMLEAGHILTLRGVCTG